MILSAAHRPLNPPFRRAPGASVRRDEVGAGICRGVFGTFCGQNVQSTPRAKTAVNSRPKAANNTSRRLRSVLFAAKKYITFRGKDRGYPCSATSENAEVAPPARCHWPRTTPARCRSRETKARLKVARNGAGLLANPRIGARFER